MYPSKSARAIRQIFTANMLVDGEKGSCMPLESVNACPALTSLIMPRTFSPAGSDSVIRTVKPKNLLAIITYHKRGEESKYYGEGGAGQGIPSR